jgi:hypothetical protein
MRVDKASKIVFAAAQAKRRVEDAPFLDLDRKKEELHALQMEFDRDARRFADTERSRQNEILNEMTRSLTDWLNDIWSVAFEFRTEFKRVHSCLILCAVFLDEMLKLRVK